MNCPHSFRFISLLDYRNNWMNALNEDPKYLMAVAGWSEGPHGQTKAVFCAVPKIVLHQ